MAGGLIFKYFKYLNLYLYLPHLYLTNSANYLFWVTKESIKIHMNVYILEYLYMPEEVMLVVVSDVDEVEDLSLPKPHTVPNHLGAHICGKPTKNTKKYLFWVKGLLLPIFC